ncbi:MAG TPA: FtsX-like permease family protein [Pyrinomonadaceae bacterium]|nr:FtsX-like permease family protein [Pyrinomonadaceae bacterium]
MYSALAFIALRQSRQHKLRTTLTILSVALGVAVFFGVRTANTTLLDSLRLTVEKIAGRATLQITASESGFPEDLLNTVRLTPGVQLTEPVIEIIARTASPDERNLLVLGIDTGSDQELHEHLLEPSQLQMKNPVGFIMQPDSILISRIFAEQQGLKEDDKLALYTPQGLRNFTVRGIFKPVGMGEVFGGQVAVMDIYAAQRAFNRGHSIDRIDLSHDPNVPIEIVQQRLRERLPAGVDVARPSARGQHIENAINAIQTGLTITSFLALTIGVFIVFNSFSINVNQRWKEIGILRAVGVESFNVQRMFLGEALVIGLIGTLFGIVVGFYLAAAASRVIGNAAAAIYGYLSTPQAPSFRLDYAATAFTVGILATLMAAWLPARAASRVNSVLALHDIETRQPEIASGWRRVIAGLVLIVAGLALIRFVTPRVGLMWQCLYALLIQLGMIMILPKLIEWSARALRPVMDWTFGAEGVLAVDTMIKSPRRSSTTVGALMIGLSFVFSNGAFIQSQKSVLERYVNRVLNASIFVTTSEQLRSRTYHFSEALAQRIAATPGISRSEVLRFTSVPFRGDNVGLIANDMEAWFARVGNMLDQGDEKRARELMPRGEGVLIASNFAVRWGLKVNETLRIETPTGPLERPVLGIFENYDSEKGTLFMDRKLYKTHWKDDAVDYVFLNLNPGVDRNAFKNELQRALAGEQRAFIYTNEEYRQWVMKLIDQFFTLTYIQMIVAIFVAALGIINTLLISVSERKRELGVIRALGGLRSQVRKMILLEACIIAIIGVITGAISGFFNGYFLVRTAATIIAGFTLPLVFPTTLVFVTLPLVLLIALASAWWPARRAVRLPVIEAIGYE